MDGGQRIDDVIEDLLTFREWSGGGAWGGRGAVRRQGMEFHLRRRTTVVVAGHLLVATAVTPSEFHQPGKEV